VSKFSDFILSITPYYSSEMIRRLFRIVRREGLPSDFISRRCGRCQYRADTIFHISTVKCFIVLCPYLGKGYIYRKRRLWL